MDFETNDVAIFALSAWMLLGAPVPHYGRLLTPTFFKPTGPLRPSPNAPSTSIFGHPGTICMSAVKPADSKALPPIPSPTEPGFQAGSATSTASNINWGCFVVFLLSVFFLFGFFVALRFRHCLQPVFDIDYSQAYRDLKESSAQTISALRNELKELQETFAGFIEASHVKSKDLRASFKQSMQDLRNDYDKLLSDYQSACAALEKPTMTSSGTQTSADDIRKAPRVPVATGAAVQTQGKKRQKGQCSSKRHEISKLLDAQSAGEDVTLQLYRSQAELVKMQITKFEVEIPKMEALLCKGETQIRGEDLKTNLLTLKDDQHYWRTLESAAEETLDWLDQVDADEIFSRPGTPRIQLPPQ